MVIICKRETIKNQIGLRKLGSRLIIMTNIVDKEMKEKNRMATVEGLIASTSKLSTGELTYRHMRHYNFMSSRVQCNDRSQKKLVEVTYFRESGYSCYRVRQDCWL